MSPPWRGKWQVTERLKSNGDPKTEKQVTFKCKPETWHVQLRLEPELAMQTCTHQIQNSALSFDFSPAANSSIHTFIVVIKTFQSRWPRRPRQSADQTADQTEITSSSGGRPGGGPGGSSSKSSIGRPGGGPSGGSSMSGGGPSHNAPPCPPCTRTWRATR